MQLLTDDEMNAVSGATDWGQVSAGIAGVALGVAIVALPPVGAVALIGAGLASYLGGVAIGQGLMSGGGSGGGGSGSVNKPKYVMLN